MPSLFVSSFVALAASVGHVAASCAYGTHLSPRAEGVVEVGNFGYTGLTGPTNWVAIDPAANMLCAVGTSQSPIDMTAGQFTLVPASTINLQVNDLEEAEFENLGTTVEVVAKGAGSITVGGTPFELQQFHFHLPSEHLDAGTSHAMEMHMVWESAQGQIAVVGVYIDVSDAAPAAVAAPEAASNATGATERRSAKMARRDAVERQKRQFGGLRIVNGNAVGATAATGVVIQSSVVETVLSSVGQIATPGTATKVGPLAMSEIVNALNQGEFQSYTGSLTTPPCSEGVSWFVATSRLTIPTASFVAVRDVIGFNARFPQNQLGQPNLLQVSGLMLSSASTSQLALAALLGGSRTF